MRRALLSVFVLSLLPFPSEAQPLQVYARNFEPFFYRDGGELKGLEYEILDYYSRASGRPLDVHFVEEFDELLPALRAAEADLATGTITVTDERAETVDFSPSYFEVRVVVVEPTSRTTTKASDLGGLTVATMKGTTYEAILNKIPGVNLVYAVNEAEIIAKVANGEADATIVDTVLGLIYIPQHQGLHMTLPMSEVQHYGFAFPKGSPLARELGLHIARLKTSGIYFRLLEKYLGREAVEMVKASREE
jgi:ABC-type amino acid transport substrate-binding protein